MRAGSKFYIALIVSLMSIYLVGCRNAQNEYVNEPIKEKITESPEEIQQQELTNDIQQDNVQEIESSESQPKIVLKKDTHDFGDVGPGSTSVATFEFVNEGDAVLLIQQVISTCGCSEPTLIKGEKRYDARVAFPEPIAFKPGESGHVEVTFKAPVIKGAVTKHLYVVSNNPDITRSELTIKANVAVKVSISPEIIDLQLDQENANMPDLIVQSLDGTEFSIQSVTSSSKAVKIPFDTTKKATKFTLKPNVDVDGLVGVTTGNIQVSTSHPQSGRLLVRYTVKPMYEVSNPRYFLQDLEYEKPVLRENLIRSNYNKKVEIESVTSRNGYMDIDSQEYDGDHLKLVIKVTPPAKDDVTRRFISDILTIKLKDGYSLDIRVTGYFQTN